MKQVLVNYSLINTPTKVKLETDLQWYDGIKKEMRFFKGGQLQFEYKEDDYLIGMSDDEKIKLRINSNYRLLPKVVDLEINSIESRKNKKEIRSFFNEYLNYNNTRILKSRVIKEGVYFDVPDEEINDFTYQLHRSNFRYKIL